VLTHRTLPLVVLALSASLSGSQVLTAEPMNPAPRSAQADDAEGRDSQARSKLKDAGKSLDLQDYEAAVAKYTKFIDNVGVEGSCLD
jgi:hypothetical protein